MAIDWNNTPISDLGYANTDWLYGADGTARNLETFGVNFSALSLIARNVFHWESDVVRPTERLSEYIEFLLFYFGQCCIVNENGWKVKKCYPVGNFTEFAIPKELMTADYNGSNQRIYPYADVVWIKNNAQCIPTYVWLRKYCDRITHIERIMDLNIDAQKTPYLIESAPEVLLSAKNLFKQIRDVAQAVFVNTNKSGIKDKIKVLNLNAPYLVDKLYAQKQNEINDALTLLGINTIDEKRERLVTGEAEISRELTENYVDMFFSTRRTAVEQFNGIIGSEALKLTKRNGDVNVNVYNQTTEVVKQ